MCSGENLHFINVRLMHRAGGIYYRAFGFFYLPKVSLVSADIFL